MGEVRSDPSEGEYSSEQGIDPKSFSCPLNGNGHPDLRRQARMTSKAARLTALCGYLLVTLFVKPADACTRVLWNEGGPILVGRTMDWPESTHPILTVLPRGLPHDGGKLGDHVLGDPNPMRWASKYGSLVTTVYGLGAADGVNERGLTAHMLYLTAADFGTRDADLPGVQGGLWAQYALDNAASVEEALLALAKIQPIMVEAHGAKTTVHLAMEDASGDSAIVEYIAGKPVVHHGHEFRVMTNDPPYDEQLALLKAQDFSKPSSEIPLPGNVNPRDRFQRASYFLAMFPKPKTEREGVASMFAIARNASVPFGAPYKGFGIYTTEYRTVTDATNRIYFFELTTSPNVIWTDLSKLNFNANASVRMLNPDSISLSGDVSLTYETASAPF
jgi:penicillin V acylase-like amidase (Ntn superfamily)